MASGGNFRRKIAQKSRVFFFFTRIVKGLVINFSIRKVTTRRSRCTLFLSPGIKGKDVAVPAALVKRRGDFSIALVSFERRLGPA